MICREAMPVRATSTLLATLAYDAVESILQIEFCDGSIYCYFAVPEAVYHDLLTAESLGSHFNRQIRTCYRYARLRCPK
jgi:hypothetical protein